MQETPNTFIDRRKSTMSKVQFSDKLIDPEYIKEKVLEICLLLGPEDKADLLRMMGMDDNYKIKSQPTKEKI